MIYTIEQINELYKKLNLNDFDTKDTKDSETLNNDIRIVSY